MHQDNLKVVSNNIKRLMAFIIIALVLGCSTEPNTTNGDTIEIIDIRSLERECQYILKVAGTSISKSYMITECHVFRIGDKLGRQ